jgi:hypothetical protein
MNLQKAFYLSGLIFLTLNYGVKTLSIISEEKIEENFIATLAVL